MAKPVVVGAVLYDPKVSVVWDIIREFFERAQWLPDRCCLLHQLRDAGGSTHQWPRRYGLELSP